MEPAAEYLKAFLFDKNLSEEQRQERTGQVREEYRRLDLDSSRFLGDLVSDPNLRIETETVARKFKWPG